ncbi:MAG: TlpA disulfide reductase family protein [Capsulimonas sp.]|uniref:TlpA disulfide reductase family protein n=1 Tax=Capsulimonas sp. TaxID=2494211 RepID=UPI00326538E0
MTSRILIGAGALALLPFMLLSSSHADPAAVTPTAPVTTPPAAAPLPDTPAKIDPEALTLLTEVEKARKKTRSLTADFTEISGSDPAHSSVMEGSLRALKPNYQHLELWSMKKDAASGEFARSENIATIGSDGSNLWSISRSGEYYKSHVSPTGAGLITSFDPFFGFFEGTQSPLKQIDDQQQKHTLVSLTYAGEQKWDGQPYDVVDWVSQFTIPQPKPAPPRVMTHTQSIFIGPDKLVHRLLENYSFGYSSEKYLRIVELNAKLTSKDFIVTLPEGAHPPKPYAPPAPILANGVAAPNFTVTASDGSQVKLSDFKGKTVILEFWTTWRPLCQASMPHTDSVNKQVKDKGVVVLAVCEWDDKDAYIKWLRENKAAYSFSTLFDSAGRGGANIAGSLYKVSDIPTQFVIDKNGKIAASNVGYTGENDHRLEAALAKLGVKIAVPADVKS